MGCVSSTLLNPDDELSQLGSSAFGHHIVSLTSTTYGLLTLDPPPQTTTTPPTPPPRFTLGSVFPSPLSEPKLLRSEPEVINSWELMSGLDNDSFRFSPFIKHDKENSNPNTKTKRQIGSGVFKNPNTEKFANLDKERLVDRFERLCPPNGENRVVIYTTTLRGIRSTFEACNSVRAVLEGFGVVICERDVSMDKGFREELRMLMEGKEREAMVPPRVFVRGKYIGGAQEVVRVVEEGLMSEVLEGVPRKLGRSVCEGCGDARFLPCFSCSGSCKQVMVVKEGQMQGRSVVVRCSDCNENGLVLCPICS
ncbi:hypothetical protein HS088_TW20G00158 [Tripterygium wilfordii]|uniref:Glutaredoxin domain-containing protein n=2 Tax=Tripterygium wilfordii TaxID=458696 RepID=A0A7J7C6M4_TRIWF|nr:hypothetical protein HS088_TW20G00158 [Tripterygium wilfordii]